MTIDRSAHPGGPPAVGVSLGHRELSEADHWILALDPAPELASTHLVRVPYPHVAVTLTGGGPVDQPAGLRAAADLAAGDRTGRAVIFPGWTELTGVLTVGEVLARSAITRVQVLGGGTADPGTELDTGDFVRPRWCDGDLVLTATPAASGRLVPFECRNPTPCCAQH